MTRCSSRLCKASSAIVLGEHALEVATDGPILGDVDLAAWLNHAVDRLRDLLEVRPAQGRAEITTPLSFAI